MKIIEGGVTAEKGFEAAAGAAGTKYQDGGDTALISREKQAMVAGTCTRNREKAAPAKGTRT